MWNVFIYVLGKWYNSFTYVLVHSKSSRTIVFVNFYAGDECND